MLMYTEKPIIIDARCIEFLWWLRKQCEYELEQVKVTYGNRKLLEIIMQCDTFITKWKKLHPNWQPEGKYEVQKYGKN